MDECALPRQLPDEQTEFEDDIISGDRLYLSSRMQLIIWRTHENAKIRSQNRELECLKRCQRDHLHHWRFSLLQRVQLYRPDGDHSPAAQSESVRVGRAGASRRDRGNGSHRTHGSHRRDWGHGLGRGRHDPGPTFLRHGRARCYYAAFFFAVNASGDPTFGATQVTFNQEAIIIPVACTIDVFYLFQQASSGASITVTLYKSSAGTGAATSTGLSVTANNGAGNHSNGSVSVSAGDTIAFRMDAGAGVGGPIPLY